MIESFPGGHRVLPSVRRGGYCTPGYMGVTIKKASAMTSTREGRTGSKDSCRDGTRTGEGDRSSTKQMEEDLKKLKKQEDETTAPKEEPATPRSRAHHQSRNLQHHQQHHLRFLCLRVPFQGSERFQFLLKGFLLADPHTGTLQQNPRHCCEALRREEMAAEEDTGMTCLVLMKHVLILTVNMRLAQNLLLLSC